MHLQIDWKSKPIEVNHKTAVVGEEEKMDPSTNRHHRIRRESRRRSGKAAHLNPPTIPPPTYSYNSHPSPRSPIHKSELLNLSIISQGGLDHQTANSFKGFPIPISYANHTEGQIGSILVAPIPSALTTLQLNGSTASTPRTKRRSSGQFSLTTPLPPSAIRPVPPSTKELAVEWGKVGEPSPSATSTTTNVTSLTSRTPASSRRFHFSFTQPAGSTKPRSTEANQPSTTKVAPLNLLPTPNNTKLPQLSRPAPSSPSHRQSSISAVTPRSNQLRLNVTSSVSSSRPGSATIVTHPPTVPTPLNPRSSLSSLNGAVLASAITPRASVPTTGRRGSLEYLDVTLPSTAVSIQTPAQQAANKMTMDELLSEAWHLNGRRASTSAFISPIVMINVEPNQSSAQPSTNNGDTLKPIARMVSSQQQPIPFILSPDVRAERAEYLTDFIHNIWCAILKDKLASGVSITKTHSEHSAERFERIFRLTHESPELLTHDRHALDLTGVGLGRACGRVIAKFIKLQPHYTELKLGRNFLGDEGIPPIVKLLKQFKPPSTTNLTGSQATIETKVASPQTARPSRSRSRSPTKTSKQRLSNSLSPQRSPPRHILIESNATTTSSPMTRTAHVNAEVLLSLKRQSSIPGLGRRNSTSSFSPNGPMIRKLDLSSNRLTANAFVQIAQVLPLSTLRSLDLSSDHAGDLANRMGEKGATALATALAAITCPLQHLNLSGVGSTGFRILLEAGIWKSCEYSQLQSLDVSSNWMSNDAWNILMKSLKRGMCQLTHLTLAKNRFSTYGATLLFQYIQSTTVLKYLDLSMCCITTTSGSLETAQPTNHRSGPIIAPPSPEPGAPAPEPSTTAPIAAPLPPIQPHVPKDFFTSLFESMARNPHYCSLEELILDENAIGDAGSKAIGVALALFEKQLIHLKSLSLVNCNLGDLQWFSYGLSRNTSLTKLNLSSNSIGDGGSIALALGLQGRLSLDAPLMPVLTTRKPLNDYEREALIEAEMERRQQQSLEKATKFVSGAIETEEKEEVIKKEEEEQKRLDDILKNPSALSSSDTQADPSTSKDELNEDILREDGLRKPSSHIDARNLSEVPKAKKRVASTANSTRRTSIATDQDEPLTTSDGKVIKNIFYDLQPQQLTNARLNNSKRVIIYSKTSHPVSQLLHLNLTHTGIGDVGCLHFSQVITLNHSLKELILLDNDLSNQSGLGILNALKNIYPVDSIKLVGLNLNQNRISTELMDRISTIVKKRRSSDYIRRIRSYKTELHTFGQLQQNQFTQYIIDIQRTMDEDERLRRELSLAQEDFLRTQLMELESTNFLQTELDQLRRDHESLTVHQIPTVDELLRRRIKILQNEHSKKDTDLQESHTTETKSVAKLRDQIQDYQYQLEREKSEMVLEQRPTRLAIEKETQAVAQLKQLVSQMKQEKSALEAEIIRSYYAILRNSGKGVTQLLNPDSPEFQSIDLTSRASPSPVAASTSADESYLLRVKRASFFGRDAMLEVERAERERQAKEAAEAAKANEQLVATQRCVTPRLATAIRYLATFSSQPQREKVQLDLITHAIQEGRNIEKLSILKPSDFERMSPRTRSAIQKLRGDPETEWEIRLKQQAELDEQNARLKEAQRKARRKSRPGATGRHGATTPPTTIDLTSGDASSPLAGVNSFLELGGESDGNSITLSIEIVTSFLQLTPLTKVQGSTTIFSMIMRGLNHHSPIYVTLNASPESAQIQQNWENKYGEYKPNLGKRVRVKMISGEGSGSPTFTLTPATPPLTFSVLTNATSSVLMKLISERLNIPINQINSLAYQERRGVVDSLPSGAESASSPPDLIRMIRQRELKELQEKKKKQAEMKQVTHGPKPHATKRVKRKKSRKSLSGSEDEAITHTLLKPSTVTSIPMESTNSNQSSNLVPTTSAPGDVETNSPPIYPTSIYPSTTSGHHTSDDQTKGGVAISSTPLLVNEPPVSSALISPRSTAAAGHSSSAQETMTAPSTSLSAIPSINLRPFGTNQIQSINKHKSQR